MAELTTEHVWVWDGPAIDFPMGPSIMGLGEGTRYFHARNVFYMFADTTDFALAKLKGFKKVVCDITKWKYVGTPISEGGRYEFLPSKDEALKLSEFSLRYGNIVGGIMDDLLSGNRTKPEDLEETYLALKKLNPALQLYAVIYAHEFDNPALREYLPYIDVANVWVWDNTKDLRNLDLYISRCDEVFPNKPILLGLYLYDYPTQQPMPQDLLEFEFNKAAQYVREGKIIGFSILASSLIDHFPKTAEWVRRFLERNLADIEEST
ncbi:MAG: hypothetical protein JTT11_09835 [Candidatus Brockarchaeota archaeon]|nr:hypothetical protein [Candidatus Brockarchaeota archaeon]